jgi:hypothetical protein
VRRRECIVAPSVCPGRPIAAFDAVLVLGGIRRLATTALATTLTLSTLVSPALALEIREPKAHLIVDVPDGWVTFEEKGWIHSHPTDKSFFLTIKGVDHGVWKKEKEFEDGVIVYYAEHLNDVTIEKHAQRIENWHGYDGWEAWGHGKRKSDGREEKFFILLLRDIKAPTKGAIFLGHGTEKGFEKHHKGIYEALHTLRGY